MVSLECSICNHYCMDADDLVEHLQDWHHLETGTQKFYKTVAESMEGFKEAVSEDEEDEEEKKDDDDSSSIFNDDDKDDDDNDSSGGFGGFGGGSFSGGGASRSW